MGLAGQRSKIKHKKGVIGLTSNRFPNWSCVLERNHSMHYSMASCEMNLPVRLDYMPVVVLVASSIRSEDRHCNPAGSVTPMSVTTTTCAHSVVSFELEVCFSVTLQSYNTAARCPHLRHQGSAYMDTSVHVDSGTAQNAFPWPALISAVYCLVSQ